MASEEVQPFPAVPEAGHLRFIRVQPQPQVAEDLSHGVQGRLGLRRAAAQHHAVIGVAERGSYGFAQNLLRQVAYDTLSRRDRKARHLTVAAHLRAAFPGDGEEVTDVIARHYLDALDAVPGDPDAGQIRGKAIAALTRAAERAVRTGAPARAAASYAAAARLSQGGAPDGRQGAAALWEHAAGAALTGAGWAGAVEQARPPVRTGSAAMPAQPPVLR